MAYAGIFFSKGGVLRLDAGRDAAPALKEVAGGGGGGAKKFKVPDQGHPRTWPISLTGKRAKQKWSQKGGGGGVFEPPSTPAYAPDYRYTLYNLLRVYHIIVFFNVASNSSSWWILFLWAYMQNISFVFLQSPQCPTKVINTSDTLSH